MEKNKKIKKFKLQYSRFNFKQKPVEFDKRTQRWGEYIETLVTLKGFVGVINDGRCWRNGTHGKPRFLKNNVVGSWFVALDFDESKYTPEQVIEFGREIDLVPNISHFSFSQGKKQGNNFRLIFVLDRMAEPLDWEYIYTYILDKFSKFGPDAAVKDIGRLWYGGRDATIVNPELFSVEDLLKICGRDSGVALATSFTVSPLSPPIEVEFPEGWQEDLARVCVLWRKYYNGEYLNRPQRFVLFTNLKAGGAAVRDYILQLGYRTNIYDGHGFGPQEIDKWWQEDTDVKPIVREFGKDMTVAEYFKNKLF